jgi:hypothetical protein
MTDLFGVAGIDLLTRVELPGVYRGRIDSLRRLMDAVSPPADVTPCYIIRARNISSHGRDKRAVQRQQTGDANIGDRAA